MSPDAGTHFPPDGLLSQLPPPAGPGTEPRRPALAGTTVFRSRVGAPRPPAPGRPPAELDPRIAARLRARRAAADARAAAAEAGRGSGPGGRPGPETAVALTEHGLEVRLVNNQLQVRLPFRVQIDQLTRLLEEEGYRTAYPAGAAEDEVYDPDPPDTQSWGPGFDPEGYYPYSVAPDPAAPAQRSVLIFPPRPEDVVEQDIDGRTVRLPSLGGESHAVVDRWLPLLAVAAEQRGELH